jgi:hypothetical protein
MNRTTAPGSVAGEYIDDDEANLIQGTLLVAEDRNAIQEEIVHTIEGAGLTPSAGNLSQLLAAINALSDAQITAAKVLARLLTVDGSGSGLDADLLDGANKSIDGTLAGNSDSNIPTEKAVKAYADSIGAGATAAQILTKLLTVDGSGSGLDADLVRGTTPGTRGLLYLAFTSQAAIAAQILTDIKTVDGAGSGLDADLLDGQSSAYYLPASDYTAADVLAKIKTVDGAGSGLNADLLDSLSSTAFLRADDNSTHAITNSFGTQTLPAMSVGEWMTLTVTMNTGNSSTMNANLPTGSWFLCSMKSNSGAALAFQSGAVAGGDTVVSKSSSTSTSTMVVHIYRIR